MSIPAMHDDSSQPSSLTAIVSFRGNKIPIIVNGDEITVGDVKAQTAASVAGNPPMEPKDVKLLFKGKVLNDDHQPMSEIFSHSGKNTSTYRLVAMGISAAQARDLDQEREDHVRKGPRIKNDLTPEGRAEMERRKRLGAAVMAKSNNRQPSNEYGFGKIEVLPHLPNESKARQILTSLANDPGVLACMAKHKWKVGSLAELYPKGKVGSSPVCVMGLNENKGQRILLRLRTDDLKGFRKILSIKKVLYHELAHNVHSDHDNDFFKLMRQVEIECNEMDWTQGGGITASSSTTFSNGALYTGGTYILGSGHDEESGATRSSSIPLRELLAQAAEARMTKEEQEIQEHCGCGRVAFDPSQPTSSEEEGSKHSKDSSRTHDDSKMDVDE